MATKADPGKYDCYTNAADDEPMFVLLARDLTAPHFVDAWRAVCAGDLATAIAFIRYAFTAYEVSGKPQLSYVSDKSKEAHLCSEAMHKWYRENRKTYATKENHDV